MAITYEDVQSICNQFQKNDEKITTRKVRDILGEGSLTTISEHLKKWRSLCGGGSDVHPVHPVQPVQSKHIVGGVSTLMFSICTVSLFWGQATSVYEDIGFKNGDMMALGGVLMVVGFAAYHAYFPKSWIAVLSCVYAFCYEGYFVVSGTLSADRKMQLEAEYDVNGIDLLILKTEKAYKKYSKYNQRYEDENDKMYHNQWFESEYLNPAFKKYEELKIDLNKKRAKIDNAWHVDQITALKIFYRLGLVLLAMVFVHQFIGIIKILSGA